MCLTHVLYRWHPTVRTHAHIFLVAHFTRERTCGSRLEGLTICLHASKVIPSLVMSLLNVPSTPCPPIFSSPTATLTPLTASPTPLTGIWSNPCVTLFVDEPSGHLADSIPNTDYEPKFCIDVSSEHTPINLPNPNMSFQQEYDATITASEDLNLPRHSGASSSSQHTTASAVHTLLKLGSLGISFTKLLADCDSVASRNSIKETCADMDRETVVSSLFWVRVKGEERSRPKRCANIERQAKSPQNPSAESWIGRPKRENDSAESIWSWGKRGG